MNENFEALAAKILETIKVSKNVLLHCHPSPDPDSTGSALAVLHFLEEQGKKVTLIKGDSPIPDFAEFLPGHEKIVEKNYLEVDLSVFDLFIILDSGGLSRVTTLGEVKFPKMMKTILIDHHASSEPCADINLIDPSYAATAEMLCELFRIWQVSITKEMAACLLTGLYTDSGGFKFANTTARTFDCAARLAKISPDYHRIIFGFENNRAPESVYFEGLALSSIQNFYHNQVAITALSAERLQALGFNENHANTISIANILKSVKGWDIGISMYEWQPGLVKLSARTRDADIYDLTKFAVLVGGGGHKAAVGAYIKKTLAEAQELVLEKLKEAYSTLD
jgi:phosphoesterase RecJ-like protein